MKRKNRLLLVLLALCTGAAQAQTQTVEKNQELGEIIRMVSVANAQPYLSFQFTTIVSDSLPDPEVSSESDTVRGSFKQSDGRFWASMDSTEYVQGFMYNLALYHAERMMAVGKPKPSAFGLSLDLLDSSFQAAHVQAMSITDVDSVTRSFKINFFPESPYSGYELLYNKSSYGVSRVTYYVKGGFTRSNQATSTAKISTTFFNYSLAPFDRDIFREERYVYKSASGFVSRGNYEGYQIIMTSDDL